jgi:hypothetical protein
MDLEITEGFLHLQTQLPEAVAQVQLEIQTLVLLSEVLAVMVKHILLQMARLQFFMPVAAVAVVLKVLVVLEAKVAQVQVEVLQAVQMKLNNQAQQTVAAVVVQVVDTAMLQVKILVVQAEKVLL